MCSESALETAVGDWMPRVWMRQQQTVLLSVSDDDDSIDYAVANAWCVFPKAQHDDDVGWVVVILIFEAIKPRRN